MVLANVFWHSSVFSLTYKTKRNLKPAVLYSFVTIHGGGLFRYGQAIRPLPLSRNTWSIQRCDDTVVLGFTDYGLEVEPDYPP